MKISSITALISLLIIGTNLYSQKNCFTVDKKTLKAYDKIDGSLYTGTCSKDYRDGNRKYMCNFENGLIQSSAVWDKDGNISDSSVYYNNSQNFTQTAYYPNGSIKARANFILSYSDKKKKMLYKTVDVTNYREDGTPSYLMNRVNDDKLVIIYYHENGKMKSNTEYTYGFWIFLNRNGLEVKYYESGNIKSEEYYSNNKLDGPSKFFKDNKENSLIETKTYYRGVLTGVAVN